VSAEPADPIERDVAKLLRRARPGIAAIPRDFHLELDLQLDSLERVELIANVERSFGIEIGPEQSARIHTFGDLVDTVARNAPDQSVPHAEWTDWTDLVRLPLTPEEKNFAAGYLRRRPVAEILWYCFGRFLALLLSLTMHLKIRYAGTFPDKPFLLCPNHLSYLDDPVIACSLPLPVFRRVFAVASTKYFKGRVATWLISLFRILPIDEDRNLLKGLRRAKAGLEGGLNLIIFPEGTRSFDGHLQELRKGASILACSLGIPVVPVGLSGTFESWPRGQIFPRSHRVAISYGEPLIPAAGETSDAFGIRLAIAVTREIAMARELRGA
jgi:long-chain acyl-CoA synthetase